MSKINCDDFMNEITVNTFDYPINEVYNYVYYYRDNHDEGWNSGTLENHMSENDEESLEKFKILKENNEFNTDDLISYVVETERIKLLELAFTTDLLTVQDHEELLKYTIYNGKAKVLKYLINIGIDLSIGHNFATKLSPKSGQIDIIEILIENGQDITLDDNFALRYATYINDMNIIKFLVKNGADVTAKDNYCIKCSTFNKLPDLMRFFKESGAEWDPNLMYYLKTIIYSDIYHNAQNINICIKYLIDNGVDINDLSDQDIQYCFEHQNQELIIFLLENKIKLSFMDNYIVTNSNLNKIIKLMSDQNINQENLMKFLIKSCFELRTINLYAQ
ncbi:ankyrin repeat protein [Cotonvirus japonicus]|uniref:Ankyrin repeat protein n=1 Tax=Cotonvirus japonicus TaxID=2811091 RepID=A0ABM7NR65_9VIRU|nr:ankyrin repeat protein [Cotonvirus japonicus]BCS82586.1 ankyrin repeat protein [Cotonvirus japonicus]